MYLSSVYEKNALYHDASLGTTGVRRGCAGMASRNAARRYLILDHVERIRDADVLAVLLRLREYTGRCPGPACPNVSPAVGSAVEDVDLLPGTCDCSQLWALTRVSPGINASLGREDTGGSEKSLSRLTCHVGLVMGLFLISQIPWGSNAYEFDTLRCPRPLQICFPGYRIPELLQVHSPPPLNAPSGLRHCLL